MLVWNLVFAFLSVVVCFGLGLLLALVFDDERLRGRKIYRSLIIIPYALPAFMTALVWRGMFNTTFGINRWLGTDIGWLESTGLAMFSLILVNMWLGYPYMFLVCTGALQSIPSDLKEAAFVDGATGLTTFRKVTFPLLLTSVSPLLVASFAFNFNNFTLVYLLTAVATRERRVGRLDGHPADVGLPDRPGERPEAPGPRRRAVGADLHHRRRARRCRVQGHQDVRGGPLMSVGEVGMAARSSTSSPSEQRRTPAADAGGSPRPDGATWSPSWRCCSLVPGVDRRHRGVLRERHAGRSDPDPGVHTTKQYDTLVEGWPYWNWFVNSLLISTIATAGTVLLASLAAYAFSRLRFKGRRPGLFSLLLIQMFPPALAFVAIFIMVDNLDDVYPAIGAGSIIAIILFYLGGHWARTPG